MLLPAKDSGQETRQGWSAAKPGGREEFADDLKCWKRSCQSADDMGAGEPMECNVAAQEGTVASVRMCRMLPWLQVWGRLQITIRLHAWIRVQVQISERGLQV